MTKFRTTRYRRIQVIYGIVSNGIRHDNHHTVEIRRLKIDDLENVGFPAKFLGTVAIRNDLPILHYDADFEVLSRNTELEVTPVARR